MGRIRVLDAATISKIAAGEVVERPASVVKELVENSLDAGATSVSVSVEDGGRKAVRVRDDGMGMSREDALASVERHSTSKISSIADLQSLSTYGFRGEALASIASVSRLTIRTREHGANEGTELRVCGGKLESSEVVGCPPGTEIAVEDLFFNVPARRKGLRSRAVELSHCREVVVSYLLCRPGVSFSFASDGEPDIIHVPAEGMNGSLVSAFGAKVAANMLFGDADGDGIRVEAYVGRLEHTKGSPSDLKIFVNDRPVRSARIVSAVVRAYGSRLMKDRYPVGVVRVFVSPDIVDVNVHPAKREVRFDDENKVTSIVERCVASALGKPDLSFKYDLTKFAESFTGKVAEPISAGRPPPVLQERIEVEEIARPEGRRLHIVPLAQIMRTYILGESEGNLMLIDQHAASERVVYERLLKAVEEGTEISQRLLTPLVMNLTPTEIRVFEEHRDVLEKAGFEIEPFGKGAYALRAIPTVLGVAQGESAFRNILADLAQSAPSKKLGLEVIWRVACHTAVRAGDVLTESQMRQLLIDLSATESPYTCEHGRPTMIVLSPSDLERLFKRRV